MKVKLSLSVLVGLTFLALSSLTASANELKEVELEVRGMMDVPIDGSSNALGHLFDGELEYKKGMLPAISEG